MGKMPKFVFFLSLYAIAMASIIGCGKPKMTEETPPEEFISQETVADSDFTIVVVDSVIDIKASDLINRLNRSFVLRDGGFLDSTTYFDTLQNIILDTVVSLEAERVDLRDDFNQYFTYLDRFRAFYLDYLYRHLILDSIKVDSAMVDSFYQAHPEMFSLPEQVRARHIMISRKGLLVGRDSLRYLDMPVEEIDSLAEVMINDIYAMYQAGATIEELARQYSQHTESAQQGGDLGYFKRGTFIKDFEDVVFGLDSGAVSEPFKTQDGWHIVEIVDHNDSGMVTLDGQYYDMARRQIESDLAKKTAYQFMDSLVQVATYEFNDSALAVDNPYDVPRSTWSIVINGRDTLFYVKVPTLFEDYAKRLSKDKLSIEDKKEALKTISRQILIMEAGDDLGFGDDPPVVEKRQELDHKYRKAIIYSEAHDNDYEITDSMLEKYYHDNIDKYIIEKPLKVQHIIVKDSVYGEFLRDQAMSGVDFLELAKENYPGAEEIRVAAADLGYIGPGEMPPEFYDAALRTSVGDVSHPVKTELGYHIIKVLDKRLNMVLEQVKGQITTELRSEHQKQYRKNWQKNLFSKHRIQYFLDDIKRIKIFPTEERKIL